jgi:long-subunit acyl-CoA synthetase (AMP-forming)
VEDAATAQVTALLSVPRIYNKIADGVRTNLA